ncbi:hypothetical protein J3R82DRAFT_5348 [Butyriboletus roseoflavus]|nr:hypothetical protein J3R82DRAFT_5348 [Butyriboletus roseoflavus]
MEGVPQLPQGLQPQGGQPNAEEQVRREAEESMRREMMATVLDTAARERRKCSSSRPQADLTPLNHRHGRFIDPPSLSSQ